MTGSRDDFAAIPILLELVPEQQEPVVAAPALPAVAAAGRRETGAGAGPSRGREAQQSLFDDVAAVSPPPRSVVRRPKPSPTLQRLAEEMLRAKAPAIISELADEHAHRLAGELRERLRAELARLLVDLAEQDPGAPAEAPAPECGRPSPSTPGDVEIPGN